MKTRIKVCGLTNMEDVRLCAEMGVDYLGFIFAPSPRKTDAESVLRILGAVDCGESKKTGVFADQDREEVMRIAEYCGLDALQFHGKETPEYCGAFPGREIFKAFPAGGDFDLSAMDDYRVDAYLLDTFLGGRFGGTGRTFDWNIAAAAAGEGKKIILSGGLNPDNVLKAISVAGPFCVDVCSGVEAAPGIKDKARLSEFIERVRCGHAS